jgi:hypothetical protein
MFGANYNRNTKITFCISFAITGTTLALAFMPIFPARMAGTELVFWLLAFPFFATLVVIMHAGAHIGGDERISHLQFRLHAISSCRLAFAIWLGGVMGLSPLLAFLFEGHWPNRAAWAALFYSAACFFLGQCLAVAWSAATFSSAVSVTRWIAIVNSLVITLLALGGVSHVLHVLQGTYHLNVLRGDRLVVFSPYTMFLYMFGGGASRITIFMKYELCTAIFLAWSIAFAALGDAVSRQRDSRSKRTTSIPAATVDH